jgi:YbbR domain-containing protein
VRAYQIRYALLALVISSFLWAITHGSTKIDRGFDIPVVFEGVPETLVITEKSTQMINIRVLGSRSALREVSPTEMEYGVNLEGAKPGEAIYLVDETAIDLPTGARILSRSPSTIELKFERRTRKSVRVEADLEGEPGAGFVVTEVALEPPRVWLAGARSEVLRLSEVVTETIDLAGLETSIEREVRISLGAGHVWVDQDQPLILRIQIDPVPDLELVEGAENG